MYRLKNVNKRKETKTCNFQKESVCSAVIFCIASNNTLLKTIEMIVKEADFDFITILHLFGKYCAEKYCNSRYDNVAIYVDNNWKNDFFNFTREYLVDVID